jgi:uncharacterized membrane protein (UPF0127 family)
MIRCVPALALAIGLLVAPAIGVAPAYAQDTSKAQAELPKEKLTIITKDGVRHDFQVEMALTEAQQTVGLMFRKTVPADGGMLFDWGTPRTSTMWMRNTVSPLDMVFINQDGTVRRVVEDTVPESLAIIDSHGPVRATLELAAGTAKRLNIHAGDKVEQRVLTGPVK